MIPKAMRKQSPKLKKKKIKFLCETKFLEDLIRIVVWIEIQVEIKKKYVFLGDTVRQSYLTRCLPDPGDSLWDKGRHLWDRGRHLWGRVRHSETISPILTRNPYRPEWETPGETLWDNLVSRGVSQNAFVIFTQIISEFFLFEKFSLWTFLWLQIFISPAVSPKNYALTTHGRHCETGCLTVSPKKIMRSPLMWDLRTPVPRAEIYGDKWFFTQVHEGKLLTSACQC